MATLKNTTIDDTGSIRVARGTTSDRPSSPQQGMIRFNTSTNKFEAYDGSEWVELH